MNKIILALLGLLLSCVAVNAQAPNIEWQKCYGSTGPESPMEVIQTSDSGYVIFGLATVADLDVISGPGGYDFWIVKVNKSGSILWTKRYGSPVVETVQGAIATSDGGFAIISYTTGQGGNVSSNHMPGKNDIWVVKLNSVGVIEWEKCYGGPNEEYGYDLKQTADGGYILLGGSSLAGGDVTQNHGQGDYWLIKINPTGAIQWQKSYGGAGNDYGVSVVEAHNGGYLMAGYTHSINTGQVSGHHGLVDFWVVKVNDTGMLDWQKCYGGNNWDRMSDMVKTNEGYLLCGKNAGYTGDISGNTHGSLWLVSINDLGGIIWQKTYGGVWGGEEEYRVLPTKDNGYLLAGNTYGKMGTGDITFRWDTTYQSQTPPLNNLTTFTDFWLFKINSSGTMLWQKTLGGTGMESYACITETMDNGIMFSGRTTSNNGDVSGNKGDADVWLVKLKYPLGIDETITTNYHMQLSPNPTSGSFKLQYELGSAEEVSILLTDSKGRLLRSYRQQGKRGGNTFHINEQGLATGIYFVTLQTAGGQQSLMLQQW